jgi:hypothetical protein
VRVIECPNEKSPAALAAQPGLNENDLAINPENKPRASKSQAPIWWRKASDGGEEICRRYRSFRPAQSAVRAAQVFFAPLGDGDLAENLHRSELTVQERAAHVAEWVRLIEKKVSAQVAQKPKGGRPEVGLRAAARELKLDRDDVRRAVKIDSISPEAKEAAKIGGAS